MFTTRPPKVELMRYFQWPLDLAASAALTCTNEHLQYSADPKVVRRLVPAVYKAGHHTLFQHSQFLFGLTGVSRQLVWSFLHSHPHYNSSQQSQRYVPMSVEGVIFREISPGGSADWHPAPLRQLAINLSGEAEIEVTDGTKRRVGPGQIFLVEDTTGKGHKNTWLDDDVHDFAFLPLKAPDQV